MNYFGRTYKALLTEDDIEGYKLLMSELRDFCKKYNIDHSRTMDSYYFSLNGKKYRVSNHTIEASNRAKARAGKKPVHPEERESDVIYIYAGKTRIRQIYLDLLAGYELNGRGVRKEVKTNSVKAD